MKSIFMSPEQYYSPVFDRLLQVIEKYNVNVNHFFEAGAFNPTYSMGVMYATLNKDARISVVEPMFEYAAQLDYALFQAQIEKYAVFNVALGDSEGKTQFCVPKKIGDRQSSAYIKGNHCAYLSRGKFSEDDVFEVSIDVCPMSYLDDGTIDLLTIDVEGSEYSVLNHLVSNPAIVLVELYHSPPKEFANEKIKEISDWFEKNDYVLVDVVEPDFLFVKRNLVVDASGLTADRVSAIEYAKERGYDG